MSPFISSSGLSPGSREAKVQRAKVCLSCMEPSVARTSYWSLPVGRYLSDSHCKGSVVILARHCHPSTKMLHIQIQQMITNVEGKINAQQYMYLNWTDRPFMLQLLGITSRLPLCHLCCRLLLLTPCFLWFLSVIMPTFTTSYLVCPAMGTSFLQHMFGSLYLSVLNCLRVIMLTYKQTNKQTNTYTQTLPYVWQFVSVSP